MKIVTESYEINPHNGPDIWIDRGIYGQRWYVARGTQRLGHLANMNGYIVLDYLIKNRDKECSYKSLIMEAYPTEWSADIQNYMSILSQIIRDIRLVIEEDPDDPKLLIDTGTGFRLNL